MKSFLILITCCFSFGVFAQKTDTLHFVWEGDSLIGQHFEKAAMLIPVQMSGDTTTYYFQFDTGADASFLYIGDDDQLELNFEMLADLNFETSLGKIRLDTLSSMSPYCEDGRTVIGTIGANVFAERALLIDFPNQQLMLTESVDNDQFEFIPMEVNYGRPAIRLQFDDATHVFLFDTGSSIFDLLATEKIAKKYRQENAEWQYLTVSSWGKQCSAPISRLKTPVVIDVCGGIRMSFISYIDSQEFNKGLKSVGVAGVIGNVPFLKEVVLIDIANKRFGVKCR